MAIGKDSHSTELIVESGIARMTEAVVDKKWFALLL
jgi:hypothetical protein